jgi:hypothetical protein
MSRNFHTAGSSARLCTLVGVRHRRQSLQWLPSQGSPARTSHVGGPGARSHLRRLYEVLVIRLWQVLATNHPLQTTSLTLVIGIQ